MKKYDVIVIGGGPGGYSAAVSLAKAGKKVCLFEYDRLGGTCLNVGCIPTKYLLDKAAVLDKYRALTDDGILRGAGEYSMKAIVRGRDAVTDRLRGGVAGLLRSSGVTVVAGKAELIKAGLVKCNDEEYEADDIIIATGSTPARLPIEGAELCIDSTAALTPNLLTEKSRLPERLIIIGGGVIGLELGSAYLSFGSEVTVIEALPDILTGEQPEAASIVRRGLEARKMNFLCGTKVLRVKKDNGVVVVETEKQKLTADAVLLAAGRRPCLDGIDVNALSIAVERGAIKVNEKMQTAAEHIYAIGDVTGGTMLAHSAYYQADVAVSSILGNCKDKPMPLIPHCIYTSPALASVGLNSVEAQKRGIDVVLGRADYASNGMAVAEGEKGAAFAVCERQSGRLIGFTVAGASAPELIMAASLAVKQGLTVSELSSHIVAHPTLSEVLKEAVLDCQRQLLAVR